MSDLDFAVYTDGSANSTGSGGAACIVVKYPERKYYYLMSSLGDSTNNQAELFSSFLGFSLINTLVPSPKNKLNVKLISDSNYLLLGGTEYIHKWKRENSLLHPLSTLKNKTFWVAFQELTRSIEIKAEHTKGHAGHGENEKCHFAASWCRKNGLSFPSCAAIELKYKKKSPVYDVWYYVNLSNTFRMIKALDSNRYLEIYKAMNHLIYEFNYDEVYKTEDRVINQMLSKIEEAYLIGKAFPDDDKITKISKDLKRIVQELSR